MGILQKVSWVTRKWNFKIQLCDIYINKQSTWGIEIFNIKNNFKSYSLFSILFRLPNGGSINRLVIDDFDFLFLHQYLWGFYDKLSDRKMWSGLSKLDSIKLSILEKLFK